MRIDGDDEDVLIASLLLTSRLHIEVALSLALITQSWKLTLDRWPRSRDVELPLTPLRAIDEDSREERSRRCNVVPAESYLVDLASRPARLVWNNTGAAGSASSRERHRDRYDSWVRSRAAIACLRPQARNADADRALVRASRSRRDRIGRCAHSRCGIRPYQSISGRSGYEGAGEGRRSPASRGDRKPVRTSDEAGGATIEWQSAGDAWAAIWPRTANENFIS